MKCVTFYILIFAYHVLLIGCGTKYVESIQLHETIEDTEFEGMYGPDNASDLPATGIVIENNSDTDITVIFDGNTIRTASVSSGETSNVHLPPGTYKYTISTAADTQTQSMSLSKVLKRDRPIDTLKGEKTVREKCRTTFNVFLEKRAVE